MYNVAYINEEKEIVVHDNVTLGKVVQILGELNIVESLTIVASGGPAPGYATAEESFDDPIEVLSLCEHALNEIPRTHIRHELFPDSYRVASVVSNYLRRYKNLQ